MTIRTINELSDFKGELQAETLLRDSVSEPGAYYSNVERESCPSLAELRSSVL